VDLAIVILLVLLFSFNGHVCSDVMSKHINTQYCNRIQEHLSVMFFRHPHIFIHRYHEQYIKLRFVYYVRLVEFTDVWSYQVFYNYITSNMIWLFLISFFGVWGEDNSVQQISFYHCWETPILFVTIRLKFK
jgi:hypothetical protein